MESPALHFPSVLSNFSSSSSSSSSSPLSTSMTSPNILTTNTVLMACVERSAPSHANLSDASNNLQSASQSVQVYDEHAATSKKRKLASSMQVEEAHMPITHAIYSPQHKVDQLYSPGMSTIRDYPNCYKEGNDQEELAGCTTPPYVQGTYCNAAHVHNCSAVGKVTHNEGLINADLVELHAQTNASIGDNRVSPKGELLLQRGDGVCGCSPINERGPPPAPRKPKAKPRILKLDHLRFFIPPDLDVFFSSSTPSPTNTCNKQVNRS